MFKKYITTVLYLLLASKAMAGDRLLATGGVMQIEGAAGGGLVPWALISGYGTDRQIGTSAFYTELKTNGDFELSSGGMAVGFNNRVELSFSQLKFVLSDTVPGESIKMNTLGVKVRIMGDAVYDQDTWLPQIAVGAQVKHNEDFNFIPQALGGENSTGIDLYAAATKLYLGVFAGRNVLINGTLRATKANQFGILGFGGDKSNNYRLAPAFSAAVMLSDSVLIGAEYRAKPNNLNSFKEENAHDVFVAWFPHRNFSLTAAYVDLNQIANKANQRAWYLSGMLTY